MKEDDFIPYKDISELKKELEGKLVFKEHSKKELEDPFEKLIGKIDTMMDVFAAASEQMKNESTGNEGKKHDLIISKLDKIIDQNKTIAEAMVAIVEMVKGDVADRMEAHEPREEPRIFKPARQEWPKEPMMPVPPAEPMMPRPQPRQMQQMNLMPAGMPDMGEMHDMGPELPHPEQGMHDLGDMPPMESSPPDFNFPEDDFPLDEPKKKGLFGMFKK